MWKCLHPSDLILAGYSAFLAALIGLFRDRIGSWQAYLAVTLAVPAVGLGLAALASLPRHRWARVLRAFDLVVLIPVLFFVTIAAVHRVHPVDYDRTLMAVDRWIGGDRVLAWMSTIETPALNEAMLILWVSYYAMPVIPAIELYVRRRHAFFEAKTMILLAFVIPYVGYFAAPALGAGFFLADMGVPAPGPGLAATAPLQHVIFVLEGAEARDTYPSGHVMVAVVTLWFVLRRRLWLSWFSVPQALGVIFSTVYLRYHYLTDVIVGVTLGGAAILLGWWFDRAARPSDRTVVYESRRNVATPAVIRLVLAGLLAVPAWLGTAIAWRAWAGLQWPDGQARTLMLALPLSLVLFLSLLWSGAASLARGRRFALLDVEGITIGSRLIRWSRVERLERTEEGGGHALRVVYRPGYVMPGDRREETMAHTTKNPSHLAVAARLSRNFLLKFDAAEPVRPALTPPLS